MELEQLRRRLREETTARSKAEERMIEVAFSSWFIDRTIKGHIVGTNVWGKRRLDRPPGLGGFRGKEGHWEGSWLQ